MTHTACITGPVPYLCTGGKRATIPLGPCLVGELEDDSVDIFWGPGDERSTVLPSLAFVIAERDGHLVLFD